MNWVVYHFISGDAFYSGSGLMLAAVLMSVWSPRQRLSQLCRVAALLGYVVVVLSATPLPSAQYVVLGLLLVTWLLASWAGRPGTRGTRLCTFGFALGILLINVREQLDRQQRGRPIPSNRHMVYVVGDSLSAGIQTGEMTWPLLLARQHSVLVTNLARPGATVSSAREQIRRIRTDDDRGLVVALIGGNDLLGGTSAADFAAELASLTWSVAGKGREPAMLLFELPLPPYANHYGLAQRQLLREGHLRLRLLPRRELAKIICTDGYTTDGLHLSLQGHQAMADLVWRYIAPYMLTNVTASASATTGPASPNPDSSSSCP